MSSVLTAYDWRSDMRITFIAGTITTVVLAALLQTAAQSQAEEPDGAKVLGHFVGSWHAEVTAKPSTSSPNQAKYIRSEHAAWTLKDRFILGREISHGHRILV